MEKVTPAAQRGKEGQWPRVEDAEMFTLSLSLLSRPRSAPLSRSGEEMDSNGWMDGRVGGFVFGSCLLSLILIDI